MKEDQVSLPPFTVEHVVASLSQVEGWGISQLNVPNTWMKTQGKDITAMVIDTGHTTHPDLIDGMFTGMSKSFVSGSDMTDRNGHSTHCAGIIGARNNASGMVGVAPECNIITCKVLGDDGTGSMGGIIASLEYAAQIKPDVVSMSLGSPVYSHAMHRAIKRLTELNIPVVAASGNDGRGSKVSYPGRYPETICVTAFDKKGNPAYFNSIGESVDFSAPGVDIYSTYLNNGYAKLSGTSMATPFITGLICLLLAKHRVQETETGQNDCKTVDQIKQHLIKYADDKGIVGKDNTWGYGVIDPEKLISEAEVEEKEIDTIVDAPKKKCFFKRILDWLRRI